jgi:signal transduction histidine kinase
MKTQAILFVLLFPIILLGQSWQTDTPLPIVEEGEKLLALNLPDSALVYAHSILNRPKLDLLSKNQALLVSGRALFNSNNIDASIYPLQKSLSISRKLKNKSLMLLTLIALAGTKIVSENPSLDSAQILLEAARPMAEASNDTRSMGRIYNGLAIISTDKLDYSKASEFCSLCESILKNSNFKREKAFCYNTTGNYFDELYKKNGKEDDLRTALGFYQKAADIFQEIGDKRLEANIRLNLGSAAGFLDDYAKAEMEVKHAMKLGEELKDSTILLDGYYALANNYEGENRMEEAKLSLNNMIALLKKTGTTAEIAFVKDQFSNQDIEVSTAFVKNRVDLLDKQIEIAKSAGEKQILWFVSILLILIIIGISIYVYQKSKLAAQKQKLIQERLENTLKSQELAFMRARFEGEEEGRHRIARLIHDGVGGLLISAKWNLESALEEISKKETKVAARLNENLRLQEHSYKELRRVVYALEREDTAWWDDLQKFYQRITAHDTAKIRFYTYNLDQSVGGKIGNEARLIVQEIITNALKHAKASEINVQINQIGNTLGIIIEDNGIGFDSGKIQKGLGFQSIEERCSKLGGSVSFESEKGHGTTVFVDIPVDHQNMLKENPLLYAGTN